MGGTTSKHQDAQNAWNATLTRSVSVPTSSSNRMDTAKMPWKSRLLSMASSLSKRMDSVPSVMLSSLKSVQEENESPFVEYSKGLNNIYDSAAGQDKRKASVALQGKSPRLLKRSMTVQSGAEAAQSQSRSNVVPSRNEAGIMSISSDDSNLPADLSAWALDKDTGLRWLIDPSAPVPPPQIFASPRRGVNINKALPRKDEENDTDFTPKLKPSRFKTSNQDDEVTPKPKPSRFKVSAPIAFQGSSDDDCQESSATTPRADAPIFDPNILATFEKAVEDLYEECWQSSEVSTSRNTASSTETFSDAESPKWPLVTEAREREEQPIMHTPHRKIPYYRRNSSISKVFALVNDPREWTRDDYLDQFERKCPHGCESKVVLYFTSLRGVRKTFEDGFMLRLILKGFRVRVDERDVWMHSKFRQELTDVMGSAVSVPRLFILGRYIGGADEVRLLHEEGILAKLVQGLPNESRQVCDLCADVRFVPCSLCMGSCKLISDSNITKRCWKCNENGLIMCPLCE